MAAAVANETEEIMTRKMMTVALVAMCGLFTIAVPAQFEKVIKQAKDKVPAAEKDKPNSDNSNASDEATVSSTGSRAKMRFRDDEFVLIAKNDRNGDSVGSIRACVPHEMNENAPLMSKSFIGWITDLDITAALKSFERNVCHAMAFRLNSNPQYKWRNVDSLAEFADGLSAYKVIDAKLVLIKKFGASQFYVVVVSEQDRPGMKLADLRICVSPDTKLRIEKKVKWAENCHDLADKIWVFEKYKQWPGPTQTNSVLLTAEEFATLTKQGKLKGQVNYKLVGDDLVRTK
jgi:hypothetical protein